MDKEKAIEYGLLAIEQLGFEQHVLDEFEAEFRYIVDVETNKRAE